MVLRFDTSASSRPILGELERSPYWHSFALAGGAAPKKTRNPSRPPREV